MSRARLSKKDYRNNAKGKGNHGMHARPSSDRVHQVIYPLTIAEQVSGSYVPPSQKNLRNSYQSRRK